VGVVKDTTGSFKDGLLALAVLLVVGAIATLFLRRASVLRL